MTSILVIIRGNSGSGKTYLADKLQQYYGYDNCFLLHQDIIRRNILHASDHAGTPAVDLVKSMAEFGIKHYPVTILEGILREDVYGKMLRALQARHNTLIYYLNISFETTLKRDAMKEKSFGKEKLQQWWREADYLTEKDIILPADQPYFDKIVKDINKFLKK